MEVELVNSSGIWDIFEVGASMILQVIYCGGLWH